uniref:Capsid maturation protease n=1 Tax=Lake sturgeon herpesvirus TaxID=2922427 RepID=A0A9E9JTX7_9VIRU|nr:capsid maturation protease [Lake sturgeon herpesvirus]
MSVFHTTDHRVAVSKPTGGYVLYDIAKQETEYQDHFDQAQTQAADTVPVYCPQCFKTPRTQYEKTVADLTPNGAYLVGTVGLFNDDKTDYEVKDYPSQRNHEGDLAVNTLGRYHLSIDSLNNTHHLSPGTALYNHNADGCLGNVLCYWHVHHPVKNLVGFNALVRVDNQPGQYGRVFWDTASEAITGFSWGSLETTEGRLVTELSAVHVPGRKGCFARAVTGVDDTRQALEGLCFGAEPCQTLRAGLFETPLSSNTEQDPVEKFLAHYKLSMDQYLSINKLVYKHKGDTHIEQYLHKGIDDYKQLYGQTTTDHTVTNRLITANMNTQQQPLQPQPQPQPSMSSAMPYYNSMSQNQMTQYTIQEIMQKIEAKHKKQLEVEKREREQEKHKQELDMLKNTVLKLQARLEETPAVSSPVKKAKIEEEDRQPAVAVEDPVTQRLNQITGYLQKLIEMPQTTPSATMVQPHTTTTTISPAAMDTIESVVTIPVVDYNVMKKMMEDISSRLSVPDSVITPIKNDISEVTPALITASVPLKSNGKRKHIEPIDSVFSNL